MTLDESLAAAPDACATAAASREAKAQRNGALGSVAIVGGGIIGHACALRLLAAGHAVTLFDDDAAEQAPSWGNAGHIATEQVVPLASLAMLRSAPQRLFAFGGGLDMRQPWRLGGWLARYLAACSPARHRRGHAALRALLAQALPAWRTFADDLGAPELLQEAGHIVCWGTPGAARRGEAVWRGSDIGSAGIEALDDGLRDCLAGALACGPAGAIGFVRTAQIGDPRRLRQRLRQRFIESGGVLQPHRVQALQSRQGQACLMLERGGEWGADNVLVCAGVGSAGLMASLGIHAPLVAERGYHLEWRHHDWPEALPPVVFEDRSVILTRFAEGLRLAGFVEYAPADAAPDPRKWHALQRHAEQLGLPVRGEPTHWFGARPTLPDYLPAIGRSRTAPQVYYAFGHQHLGLTLAPITALAVEALLDGRTPPVSLAAFDLARF